ncbi:serine/threonine-protein kinase [Actinoallomurus sp. NPDC050550]|uniref:serine/threonine-protein kinase n=1 Tax=Actinoallomurus sp. NPDC050550 TaxID=3154937 RepID=UPI00340A56BB
MRSDSGLRRGAELCGRYRLEERIGAGGMGEVWRGVDLRLRRPVAIKILPVELTADQTAAERFRREAETTAALQHPGITVIFDVDEHPSERGRLLFLVMELLTGQDLGTLLAGHPGGLPIGQAVTLATQTADALAAAHAHGIVHRDIKPANLFLLGDGRVKICDFGIARLADTTTRLTATGGFIGTPLYMAPEQFRGGELSARVDLYALGCVLYELLTGTPPFIRNTGAAALMYRHLNEAPDPLRARRPDVPAALEKVTLQLLAKDPGERPAGAAAVAALLRGSDGAHHPAMPTGPDRLPQPAPTETWDRGQKATAAEPSPPRRRKAVLTAVAAVVVAGVVLGGGAVGLSGVFRGGKPDPIPTPAPSHSVTPSVPSNPKPVTPGWQAVLAPEWGVAYDVPPGWKVQTPNWSSWVQDSRGQVYVGENAVADSQKGKCTRAQTGLRGGSGPVANPGADQMSALTGRAQTEARNWVSALYGGVDTPPHPPKSEPGPAGTVTMHGITAERVSFTVTTTARHDACTPPHALVETVAMAAGKDAATSGPLMFTVFADRDVRGGFTDADLNKIVASVRRYGCPAGTSLTDNTCSSGKTTPTP